MDSQPTGDPRISIIGTGKFLVNSPEYAHPKEMRRLSTKTNMVVLDGV